MSSALSNAISITRYHSYKNNILAVPFLCEANTFIHIYCIFDTFDKIHVFVRTINLFIHLASDLYMIHSAFGPSGLPENIGWLRAWLKSV